MNQQEARAYADHNFRSPLGDIPWKYVARCNAANMALICGLTSATGSPLPATLLGGLASLVNGAYGSGVYANDEVRLSDTASFSAAHIDGLREDVDGASSMGFWTSSVGSAGLYALGYALWHSL